MHLLIFEVISLLNGLIWNRHFDAMAKTVGLPVAIATLAILNNKIQSYGVQIPTKKEFYTPVLNELKEFGVIFKEEEIEYLGYNPLNQ